MLALYNDLQMTVLCLLLTVLAVYAVSLFQLDPILLQLFQAKPWSCTHRQHNHLRSRSHSLIAALIKVCSAPNMQQANVFVCTVRVRCYVCAYDRVDGKVGVQCICCCFIQVLIMHAAKQQTEAEFLRLPRTSRFWNLLLFIITKTFPFFFDFFHRQDRNQFFCLKFINRPVVLLLSSFAWILHPSSQCAQCKTLNLCCLSHAAPVPLK